MHGITTPVLSRIGDYTLQTSRGVGFPQVFCKLYSATSAFSSSRKAPACLQSVAVQILVRGLVKADFLVRPDLAGPCLRWACQGSPRQVFPDSFSRGWDTDTGRPLWRDPS